jgi:ectoine hydroxylase-related dioxygenase (phytanoyl-CoA dioxygenase family)
MLTTLDSRDATRPEVTAALDRAGAVKLTGVLDPALLAEIRAYAQRIYDERDALDAQGRLPDTLHKAHRIVRAVSLHELGGLHVRLLENRPMLDFAACVLGRPVREPSISAVRAAIPGKINLNLPFHQDSHILAESGFHPADAPLAVVWIPLEACGIDRPGLEVVARPVAEIAPTIRQDGNFYASRGLEIPEEAVLARYGRESLEHPPFAAGDVLLFRGTTIHRTYATPAMRESRLSIDLRLIA